MKPRNKQPTKLWPMQFIAIIVISFPQSLSFLFPLLRMEADVTKQMTADSNPTSLYKWIRENVSTTLHKDKGFINALTARLVFYTLTQGRIQDFTKGGGGHNTLQHVESRVSNNRGRGGWIRDTFFFFRVSKGGALGQKGGAFLEKCFKRGARAGCAPLNPPLL